MVRQAAAKVAACFGYWCVSIARSAVAASKFLIGFFISKIMVFAVPEQRKAARKVMTL